MHVTTRGEGGWRARDKVRGVREGGVHVTRCRVVCT